MKCKVTQQLRSRMIEELREDGQKGTPVNQEKGEGKNIIIEITW